MNIDKNAFGNLGMENESGLWGSATHRFLEPTYGRSGSPPSWLLDGDVWTKDLQGRAPETII